MTTPFPSDPLRAADAGDLAEQVTPVVEEDLADSPDSVAWEADSADALDQAREIGFDDDHDAAS